MRVVVLGSSASYADAGRACAGYLVDDGSTHVLIDCGHGALANLAAVFEPTHLDAVFVSHGHPDHVVDLFALQARLRYAPEGPADPLALHGPPGLVERMTCLLSDRGATEFGEAFVDEPLADGETIEVGSLTFRASSVDHGADAFALTVTDRLGSVVCYTGDAAASPRLTRAARAADVLIAEATLPQAYAGRAPHMTAREAAEVAADAGAQTLVLTHLWPTVDRDAILDEAAEAFDGEIRIAEELMEISLD